jgi:hypothetical protein
VTGPFGWLRTLWAMVDDRLAELSAKLQAVVRMLRLAVALLVVAVLLVLASPVVLYLWPEWFPLAYAISTMILVIPIVLLAVLAALPLRMKSVVRLIDKGYPENAKEIAIRIAARKLHDQSIATEELLVDTALNEARKVMERAKAHAAAEAAETPPASPGTMGAAPPGPASNP